MVQPKVDSKCTNVSIENNCLYDSFLPLFVRFRWGGVSTLTFYSVDPSLNPAVVYSFILWINCLRTTKINKKEAGDGFINLVEFFLLGNSFFIFVFSIQLTVKKILLLFGFEPGSS